MAGLRQALGKLARRLRHALRGPATRRRLRARHGAVQVRAIPQVAVFPDLGLAYNRIKKNANTSTVILLRQMETGQLEDRHAAKWHARTYFDLTPAQRDRLDALHLFVIVRNPYARVLSAFLDKFRLARYRQRHGDFPLTPEGFGAFLAYLESGGLRRDAHWDLQTRLMMLPLSGYDSVIRFETFRTGLRALLERRGLTVPETALDSLFPSDETKQTRADRRLHQFYDADRVAAVQRLFAPDFAALGYDTAFPAGPRD